MTINELRAAGIKFYADNDGGLWYWDPVTGLAEMVKER